MSKRSFLAAATAVSLVAGLASAQEAPAPAPAPPPVVSAQPPQPLPYGYPPQAYAPQAYPSPMYMYPATLPYEEGRPIPAGYHKVSRARSGLITGGAVTFGVLYSLSVAAATESRDSSKTSALYVPGLGPFIVASQIHDGSGILVIDGIAQCAGLIMLVSGIAFPKTELVRNDLGMSVTVTPMTGKQTTGLSLTGTF